MLRNAGGKHSAVPGKTFIPTSPALVASLISLLEEERTQQGGGATTSHFYSIHATKHQSLLASCLVVLVHQHHKHLECTVQAYDLDHTRRDTGRYNHGPPKQVHEGQHHQNPI